MRAWLAIAAVLAISCASAPAPSANLENQASISAVASTIHGVVRDHLDRPVPGARVVVTWDGRTIANVRTDAHGEFTAAGHVGVRISASESDMAGSVTVETASTAIVIVLTELPM